MKINNKQDVEKFFRYLLFEKGISFHIDEDFKEYNECMQRCIDVCGDEVHGIGSEIFNEYFSKHEG